MRIELWGRAFVVCFAALATVDLAEGDDVGGDSAITTTEKSGLVGSLENIVTEVQSMKARIDKILIETSTTNFIEKTRHNVLTEKGYRFTSGIGYHRLYLAKLTWHDALHFCRKEKAHLAVIDSSGEAQVSPHLSHKHKTRQRDLFTYLFHPSIAFYFLLFPSISFYFLPFPSIPYRKIFPSMFKSSFLIFS
jgi:hypothetical protein